MSERIEALRKLYAKHAADNYSLTDAEIDTLQGVFPALLDAATVLATLLDWAEREGTHPQGAEVWFAVRDDARRALAALAGREE